MPVKWKRLLVIMMMLDTLATGCSLIPANDSGSVGSNNEDQGLTIDVRGRSPGPTEVGLVPTLVDAHIVIGNVIVTVVEPPEVNHVLVMARNVILTNNEAERQFIPDTVEFNRDGVWFIEIKPGPGTPDLETHIYIHKEIPIEISADRGNIQIYGNTGTIKAQASGSIEVRGTTHDITLTTKSGIVVDGARGQLTLRSANGPIQVTAEEVKVDAKTDAGEILFVGKLVSGTTGYFTTTSNSNITVMMPRYDRYHIEASTTANTIDVQFPGIVEGGSQGNPVCATFDAGAPYMIRTDDRTHRDRGQATINTSDGRAGGLATLTGLVTQRNLAFHSTVRNVMLELPPTSEFTFQTLFDATTNPPSAEPTAQVIPLPDQLSTFMQSSENVRKAIPLDQVSDASSASSLPATNGIRMYPPRCPIPAEDRIYPRVSVVATSNGGHIRIYQNLP